MSGNEQDNYITKYNKDKHIKPRELNYGIDLAKLIYQKFRENINRDVSSSLESRFI